MYYSQDRKKEILKYAEEHNVSEAAKKYDVDQSTIYIWRKRKNGDGDDDDKGERKGTGNRYSNNLKKEVVAYYQQHGTDKTIEKYNIPSATIHRWTRESLKSNGIGKKSFKIPENPLFGDNEPSINYHQVKIEKPKEEEQKKTHDKKMIMICTEDPSQLIDVLKGIL